MEVRVLRDGYVGLKLRYENDVFEWPEGTPLGTWVEETHPRPKPAPPKLIGAGVKGSTALGADVKGCTVLGDDLTA